MSETFHIGNMNKSYSDKEQTSIITSTTKGGRRLCFHPFVCLFVREQAISKSYGRIQTKFGGQGRLFDKDEFDFGEDLDTRLFFFQAILHH